MYNQVRRSSSGGQEKGLRTRFWNLSMTWLSQKDGEGMWDHYDWGGYFNTSNILQISRTIYHWDPWWSQTQVETEIRLDGNLGSCFCGNREKMDGEKPSVFIPSHWTAKATTGFRLRTAMQRGARFFGLEYILLSLGLNYPDSFKSWAFVYSFIPVYRSYPFMQMSFRAYQ